MVQLECEEGKKLAERNMCAQYSTPIALAWGGSLGIEGWVLRCGQEPSRKGLMEQESHLQAIRRGAIVPQVVEDRIGKRMLPEKADLDRLIALVATGFAKADLGQSLNGYLYPGLLALGHEPFWVR